MSSLRTAEEVRYEFVKRGQSIAEWARVNNFSVTLVYQILADSRKAVRGQSHNIAVALGMKEGQEGCVEDLPFPGRKVMKANRHKEKQ
ncbi:MAG: DNA-binding protein [Cycloclasticus sp.]|nr:DNA-binding protein [Cycloclasticus sp.]